MEVEVHLGVGDIHISFQCNVLTMQCLPILIFSWCFGQNIHIDNSDDVLKTQNIMLTMHLSNAFQTIKTELDFKI